jgi:hypothetical protein
MKENKPWQTAGRFLQKSFPTKNRTVTAPVRSVLRASAVFLLRQASKPCG